jgi:hypothetical protein
VPLLGHALPVRAAGVAASCAAGLVCVGPNPIWSGSLVARPRGGGASKAAGVLPLREINKHAALVVLLGAFSANPACRPVCHIPAKEALQTWSPHSQHPPHMCREEMSKTFQFFQAHHRMEACGGRGSGMGATAALVPDMRYAPHSVG